MNDVICSVCTGMGIGAISIIRVSGEESIEIVNKIFHGNNLTKMNSHTISYGYIYNENEKIDEVLVNVMRAPKTYTMENVVEINSHGGLVTINKIMELLLEVGCRLAEPGEFTKRAFLNGRIDLIEAEAVNDLIFSKTDAARKLALNNMGGNLTNKISKIRQKLVSAMANIEVNIDYPEYEDIEQMTTDKLKPILLEVEKECQEMLEDSKNGRIINDGIKIALIGCPNVGKSSILNFLIDEDKAIVTDIAGTTRDIVEGSILLKGIQINFIDTAGIRATDDIVEQIGVKKSLEVSKNSDLVIVVLDSTKVLTLEEIELIESIPENKRIIFLNKSDINDRADIKYDCIKGNTMEPNGLDELKDYIIKMFSLNDILTKDLSYLSNNRQIDLIKKALKEIQNAIKALDIGIEIDLIQIDITSAWDYLGEITGESYKEELIDTLFCNFCVGK